MKSNAIESLTIAVVFFIITFVPTVLFILWVYSIPDVDGHPAYGFAFSWGDSQWKTWNWHPFLMMLAFGSLLPQAVNIYRMVPFISRKAQRTLHFAIQSAIVVFSTTSIVVIFRFKKHAGMENLYTTHALWGFSLYVLFLIQYGVGFAVYWWPRRDELYQRALRPYHAIFGLSVFTGFFGSLMSGLAQRNWISGAENARDRFYWLPAIIAFFLFFNLLMTFWLHRQTTKHEIESTWSNGIQSDDGYAHMPQIGSDLEDYE